MKKGILIFLISTLFFLMFFPINIVRKYYYRKQEYNGKVIKKYRTDRGNGIIEIFDSIQSEVIEVHEMENRYIYDSAIVGDTLTKEKGTYTFDLSNGARHIICKEDN